MDCVLAKGGNVEFFHDEFRCPIYVKDLVTIIVTLANKWTSGSKSLISRFDYPRCTCFVCVYVVIKMFTSASKWFYKVVDSCSLTDLFVPEKREPS